MCVFIKQYYSKFVYVKYDFILSYNSRWPPIGTKQSIELAYLNTWIMPTFCSGIVYNCTIFVLQNKYMYVVQFPKCFDNVTWLSLNERTNERTRCERWYFNLDCSLSEIHQCILSYLFYITIITNVYSSCWLLVQILFSIYINP